MNVTAFKSNFVIMLSNMTERIVGGIGCDHLDEHHGASQDRVDVAFWNITSHKELEVGMEGECLTGKNSECSMKHICGKVVVTYVGLPWFVNIKPVKVEYGEGVSDEVKEHCNRPPEWWMSERVVLESVRITEFSGRLVSEMSYEPIRPKVAEDADVSGESGNNDEIPF